MADDVTIRIGTRGGAQAAAQVRALGASVDSLGRAARTTAPVLKAAGTNASSMAGRGLNIVGRQARYASLGIIGLGAFAAKSGLQFNASMEQNQLAFTNFLGSAQRARAELAWLQKTAKVTPFDLPGIVQGERSLLAYGFSAKQARGYLVSVADADADAAAGAGLGADKIRDIIRVVGQIRGKGKLFTEELQQLGELGIVSRPQFAKNLGITEAQLADAGTQGISANRALRALQKTMDDQFGGQATKQAKTFNGQMSNLRDNLNQTLGAITKPGFDKLRKDVFPAANDAATQVNKIFGRKDIDFAEKMTLSRTVLRRKLGPFVTEAENAIAKMHLGEKVGEAIGAAAPKIAGAFGRAAWPAAKSFATAFIHAGPYGQLFTLGVLGAKLGVFKELGKKAAGKFGGGFGGGGVGKLGLAARGATPANPVWVAMTAGKGVPGTVAKTAGRASKALGVARTAATLGSRFLPAAPFLFGLGLAAKNNNHNYAAQPGGIPARQKQLADAGLTGPGLGGGRLAHAPAAPARPIVNLKVQVDGKDVGHHLITNLGKDVTRVVRKIAADEKARGR
jgi:tape measure domain-containing protein